MSGRQKLVLALVGVALVLLFVAAMANPSGSGQGRPGASPSGVVGLLGRVAGDAGAVPAADVSAPCAQAAGVFKVAFGGCVLTVASGGRGLRTVRLRADRALTVRSKAPRNDFTVTDTLAPGEVARVAVDEQGGAIGLSCGAATCTVTLVGGG
jgi:hypothetical protein